MVRIGWMTLCKLSNLIYNQIFTYALTVTIMIGSGVYVVTWFIEVWLNMRRCQWDLMNKMFFVNYDLKGWFKVLLSFTHVIPNPRLTFIFGTQNSTPSHFMLQKVHKTYIELIRHGKRKLSHIYKTFQKNPYCFLFIVCPVWCFIYVCWLVLM